MLKMGARNSRLVRKSQAFFQAVKKACKGNKNTKAIKCLCSLEDGAGQLHRKAEEEKARAVVREEKLVDEHDRLSREKNEYESALVRLKQEKRDEECRLSQLRTTLSEATSRHHEAENRLWRALQERSEAEERDKAVRVTAVTVGTVVGFFTFGVGGLLTGALVGGGLAKVLNEIDGRCERARAHIAEAQCTIRSTENSIRSINQSLLAHECKINAYNDKIAEIKGETRDLHNKIGEA